MTITELALRTVTQFGINPKAGIECPNEVMRDLAARFISMAGQSIEISRFWTVRSYHQDGKFYLKLDADNPFNVSDMIGSIYSLSAILINWKTEQVRDLPDRSELDKIMSLPWNNDMKIVSINSDFKRIRFDFMEEILKQRKISTIFDVCYLQHHAGKIYLIGKNGVVNDVIGKLRQLMQLNVRL